jgi:hypothetical protein
MVQTVIDFYVELDGDLAITELKAESVTDELADSAASIQYDVDSCLCDEQDKCLANQENAQATINSDINVCVWSTSTEVEILEVTEFLMEQPEGEGMYMLRAIESRSPTPLTTVSYKVDPLLGQKARIKTRLVTKFFEHDEPEDLQINGEASLVFTQNNRRRLRRVRLQQEVTNSPLKGEFDMSMGLCKDCEDDADGISSLGLMAPLVVGVAPLLTLLA